MSPNYILLLCIIMFSASTHDSGERRGKAVVVVGSVGKFVRCWRH